MNQFSYYHDGSRRHGGSTIRNYLSIGLRDSHIFVTHSQCLRGDLAEHRFCALAEFGTRDQNPYGAVSASLHAYERIEIAFAGTGKTRAMEKSRDANTPFFARVLPFLGESFLLGPVVGQFQRAIQQLPQVDLFLYDLVRGGRLSGLEKVPPSDLHRRNPQGLRDEIHVALHREERLWCAKSTKCAVRRCIGGHRFGANTDAGPIIRSTSVKCGSREHYARQSFIRAPVNREFNFSAKNFAFFAHGGPVTRSRRMPLGSSGHVFHSVVDNFYWLSR